jgi:predicted lysophospholipase L1 biosynthesis ABC-type transport system permease subunit
VTPLAYFLIVAVPLIAFITVALALLPGRPAPGRAMQTPSITARVAQIDEQLARQVTDAPSARKALERERRQLHTELMRRGVGRWSPE